jgi:ABC-type oligopeptide transport system ATPase subunit
MEDLIRIRELTVGFPIRRGLFNRVGGFRTVLNNIGLVIRRGETLGLVGESGSGKTTLGRAVLGLTPVQSGSIEYGVGGRTIRLNDLKEREFRPLRKRLQIVFQDPYSSLNPRLTVRDLLLESIRHHFPGETTEQLIRRCEAALDKTGVPSGAMDRFPHEFSGGQRQRISIARAIASEPEFIVLDECVSALDVSIQAQILNLLSDFQKEFGLSYLFISHDIAVVRYISHTIAVIHDGEIVETGAADRVTSNPAHEYTKTLIASIPSLKPAVS